LTSRAPFADEGARKRRVEEQAMTETREAAEVERPRTGTMPAYAPRRPKVRHGVDPEGFIGYLLTHFGPLWRLLESTPGVRNLVNRLMIDAAIYKTETRPYPFTTMSPFTSWDSLTDRTYSSRHLGPRAPKPGLPSPKDVSALFLRDGEAIECPKSTVLFAYFAQWFTDGFLRTSLTDPAKNTSNHEIDLSPLYGLNKEITDIVRAHSGGRLASQILSGEEYPLYLFDELGKPKPGFELLALDDGPFGVNGLSAQQKSGLFATGGDRVNVQIGYVMFNVLFLREHNRIAGLLAAAYPGWDDERLFQTARNVLLVVLIRVVIEEYINHISPLEFKFFVDPKAFPNERWYRQNWMAVEFTLVYRWHMMIPDGLAIGGRRVDVQSTMWNTSLVTGRGLGALFDDASRQPAGRIGLFNSPRFLNEVEERSIAMCRTLELASYNDYLEQYGYPRVTTFEEISRDKAISGSLRRLYDKVDNVDFYVGIFADDPVPNSVLPSVIGTLVAIDAFSQALTNPLLNENIFTVDTFSPAGMEIINGPCRLQDILNRNIPKATTPYLATLTRLDWKRS
jgi:prostaglandin-endoperoxide synthase 2